MRKNPLRALAREGRTIRCGWLSLPSSYGAEIAGASGLDAVLVDLQHGMIGFESAVPMLQAISATPAVPLVRPSHCEPAQIMKLLDAGAYGVVCPQVDTPEIARAFVAACRYPPKGNRSYGPARGVLYGGADYFQHADAEMLAIGMIESVQALRQLDAILDTPGLDGLFIGPNDLAVSLGHDPMKPGPEVDAAIARIVAAGRQRGLICGIFCANAAVAVQRKAQGFNFVVPGNDGLLLRNGWRDAAGQLA